MIDNEFSLLKILGKGSSSKVFLAKDTQGTKYALKAIRKDKNYGTKVAEGMVEREHELLTKLGSHPNIIKSHSMNLDGTFVANGQSEPVMYNVLEFAKHGAISNFVRYTGGIEEDIARLLALQICNAVQFMHSSGFAHLDIKLENILFDEFFNIKLADMGSSVCAMKTNGLSDRRRGTLLYMAPEVINLQDDQTFNAYAADIYSLGITLFVLLTGEFPNADELNYSVSTNDSGNKLTDDMEIEGSECSKNGWESLSLDARTLIQSMTNTDHSLRPSIDEVITSSWFCENFSNNILEEVYLEMSSRKEYMLKGSKR